MCIGCRLSFLSDPAYNPYEHDILDMMMTMINNKSSQFNNNDNSISCFKQLIYKILTLDYLTI